MSTLHQRRVEHEWRLLQLLAATNSSVLEILNREQGPASERFHLILHKTCALIKQDSYLNSLDTHTVALHFPEFFPSVPIEASLAIPVFHPNIHPENGFVCLWDRFSSGDTVAEAVLQLQRVITWRLVNEESDHLLQPEAIQWYREPQRGVQLPLDCQPLVMPEEFQKERTAGFRQPKNFRHRLS
jgi:ubiquitin-protein ligase